MYDLPSHGYGFRGLRVRPRHRRPRRAIRRVGEALAGRYAEIGQAIAARIVDEIPGYRDAAPELIDDLRAGATATAEVLARTLAEGSTVRREDLGFLRDLAARRVHQGVSLEVFIHAYRVALLAYWDACADEASRLRISREAGFALARSAIDAIDTITTQAAEAYLREETRLRTQSGRAARDLVERLIDGQPIDPGRRHPAAPGLDPTGQLLTVVGRVEQTTLAVGDALQVARDALEESMSLGVVRPLATIRHGELVLISAGTSPRARIASLRAARQRTDRGTQHRRPLRRQRPVARLRKRPAGLPRSSAGPVLHLGGPADRLARRTVGTRMRTDRRDRHHQSHNRLQGQQAAGTPRRRSRRDRRNDPRLRHRRPQRRQSGRTDARPPQHRALPTPADRHQNRLRPPHLRGPRRPDLHPRDDRRRPTAVNPRPLPPGSSTGGGYTGRAAVSD